MRAPRLLLLLMVAGVPACPALVDDDYAVAGRNVGGQPTSGSGGEGAMGNGGSLIVDASPDTGQGASAGSAGSGATASGGAGMVGGATGSDGGSFTCATSCSCETFSERWYMFCTAELAVVDAADHCAMHAARLVGIDSQALDEWLWERMTALGVDRYWTGGNDIQIEESWVWSDGSAFYDQDDASPVGGRYTNWLQDEPSGEADEDCLYVSDGRWRDRICAEQFAYVCEETP